MSKAPASAAATGLPEIDRDRRMAEAYRRMEYLICDIVAATAVMETMVDHVLGSTKCPYSDLVKERMPEMNDMIISVNSERKFNAAHYAVTHVAKSVEQLQRDYFALSGEVQS